MSESAEAKCDPFLQILEPVVMNLLADKGGWEAEDWDEEAFQGFFSEIALWLKNEKKQNKNDVAKTVAGLISYGVTTKEELQNIADNMKEFRETLSAEGVPKAICNLLFEQYVAPKKRKALSMEDYPSRKKICMTTIRFGLPTDNSLYILSRAIEEDGFLRFAEDTLETLHILDSENHHIRGEFNHFYIRDAYRQLYEELVSTWARKKPMVVMGTPGIGKTVFGFYCAWRLLKERNATILYSYDEEHGDIYFLGSQDSGALKAAREAGYDIPEPQNTWIGKLDMELLGARQLRKFLENRQDVCYIYDPPESGIRINAETNSLKLVVSSLHRAGKNSLRHEEILYYMPLWSLEELNAVGTKIGLSESVVAERFAVFGGVARWVLCKDEVQLWDSYHLSLYNVADYGLAILDPYNKYKDDASLFVHIVPSQNFKAKEHVISTERMHRYIALQAKLSKQWEMSQWVGALHTAGVKSASGILFEQLWHNRFGLLRTAVKGCILRELTDTRPESDAEFQKREIEVELPAFDSNLTTTFPDNMMNGLTSLKENACCLPLSPNFETVDAFVVTREPFCDKENNGLCLLAFQMTLSNEHELKQAGFDRLREKVKTLFQLKDHLKAENMYVVFVTEQHNARNLKVLQKWVTKKGAAGTWSAGVRQFVLGMPISISDSK